jgi:hypothetical protein
VATFSKFSRGDGALVKNKTYYFPKKEQKDTSLLLN